MEISPVANTFEELSKVIKREIESKVAIDNIVVAANNFSPLLTTVGFGGVAGFLIGYAVKKIMKILAVGAGIFFTALMYLESQNIVNINWDKLQNASQNAVSTLASAAGQIPLASTTSSTTINFALPMTSSAAMGFAIGFMRG